ncbi:MAG: hypothetical protein QME51_08605 [Planctomycetota bacterium]|nr:hypothetical protein [Planctomycetota bacterium]
MFSVKRNLKRRREIASLTRLWYSLVGLAHHKDRDCHWQIKKIWSYGQKPTYEIEHFGYIFGKYNDKTMRCDSIIKAEKKLSEIIKEAIQGEKRWAENVIKYSAQWDKESVERAEGIIHLLKESQYDG